MRYGWKTILTVACCSALAACASNNGNTPADGRQDQSVSNTSTSAIAMNDASTLQAYHWQLEAVSGADQAWYDSGKAALKAPVQWTFHGKEQTVSVRGLCNAVNAAYSTTGQNISFKSGFRTMMACEDSRLMGLEDRMASELESVKTWQLSGNAAAPRLVLTFANGSQWSFKGVPTNETRFGSAAEQIFLEVAPNTRSCNDGVRTRQCLEVRRVSFDENGLRQGAGPWELFYDEIEGFKHDPSLRTVLRVNRYERKNPPADASGYVYVLDMQVSAEIAR
ncbi:DUF4377 domain-containing protein [Lampropedia aestuarii]|uniref:DUF4377 domain-containing protein n=2 Tax=Lampropedia aestuarii TaxID=2562762 RepID=A0A4S5BW20_9BURK|nr:DUF4377 domain-containing protein [Lampropedia aestuarii]